MRALINLPPEILHMIAGQLCFPFVDRGESRFRDVDEAHNLLRLATLSRLSKTCKMFCAIAQPELFRFLHTEARLASAVQTLNRRPDLACVVKHLHVELGRDIEDQDWIADAALYDNYLRASLRSMSNHAIGGDEGDNSGFLPALAVTQVSNIESLSIEISHKVPLILQPRSLPYLTELVIHYWDPENGFDVTTLQSLFNAAPSLKVFKVFSADGGEGGSASSDNIFHPGLTTFELCNSALRRRCFTAIMNGFPRLEKFSYASDWTISSNEGAEATPRDISETLHIRSDTLKHLSLNFPLADYFEQGQNNVIESLAHMTVLESIHISCLAVYSSDSPGGGPNGTRLTAFLPPSIRTLVIYEPHLDITRDLVRLAEVAPASFPLLKTVRFSDIPNNMLAILQPAFPASGIQ